MNEIIEKNRKQIDVLDSQILELLSQRFSCVQNIGKQKKKFSITPLQKDRWNSLLNSLQEQGKVLDLSKNLISDIWNRIHEEALERENNIHNNTKNV